MEFVEANIKVHWKKRDLKQTRIFGKREPELDVGKSNFGKNLPLAVLTCSGQDHPYKHQVTYGKSTFSEGNKNGENPVVENDTNKLSNKIYWQ